MHKNFLTFASVVTLICFLGTPLSAFALTSDQLAKIAILQVAKNNGTINPQDAELLQTLVLLQQQEQRQQYGNQYPQQPYYGAGQQQQGGGVNPLLLAGALGAGGAGGAGGINPLLLAGAIGGGAGGGGGGALGSVSQALTLAGAISGNMGLVMAGMIAGMLGSLGGGAGATPQRGNVDEQYVAPGQAGPYGASGYNPYYTTPTPIPNATATPATACEKTIFIVKDTTVTPNTVRPYPAAVEIPQNQCVLAINSDTSASHSIQIKEQGQATVKETQSIDKEKSRSFRFETKKAYTLCVDALATACTTVTVK